MISDISDISDIKFTLKPNIRRSNHVVTIYKVRKST